MWIESEKSTPSSHPSPAIFTLLQSFINIDICLQVLRVTELKVDTMLPVRHHNVVEMIVKCVLAHLTGDGIPCITIASRYTSATKVKYSGTFELYSQYQPNQSLIEHML